jgi:hypothetical protein
MIDREDREISTKVFVYYSFDYLKFHIKMLSAGYRAVTWNSGCECIKSFINHLRDLERNKRDFFFNNAVWMYINKDVTFSFVCANGWLP